MRRQLVKFVALGVTFALFNTGCMMSRLVDRAFLGITVRRPSYAERKTTGVFLLPFTFAIDLATFPLQALLVVILGDGFPYNDASSGPANSIALLENPTFQKLSKQQQAVALAELDQLIRSGMVGRNTALALMPDGHWVVTPIDDEVRAQMIARAQAGEPAPTELALCTP